MGIFSREKYSRKEFDEAKETSDSALKSAETRGTHGMKNMGAGVRQRIYNELWDTAHKAQWRVEKLYAKGQAEATDLNEEYDCLRTKAQEAIKAIADFEREKLGMIEKEPASSNKKE